MVYFILNKDSNHVKIGYSKNPTLRIKTLQTGSSNRLELIAILKGTIKEEKFLQKKFNKYHINNEWFEYNENIREFIKYLDYNNLSTDYILTFFKLMNLTNIELYEVFKLGIHYKSYFEKYLLEKYSNYFNPNGIIDEKNKIIKEIFINKLDYQRLIDDINSYRNDINEILINNS